MNRLCNGIKNDIWPGLDVELVVTDPNHPIPDSLVGMYIRNPDHIVDLLKRHCGDRRCASCEWFFKDIGKTLHKYHLGVRFTFYKGTVLECGVAWGWPDVANLTLDLSGGSHFP